MKNDTFYILWYVNLYIYTDLMECEINTNTTAKSTLNNRTLSSECIYSEMKVPPCQKALLFILLANSSKVGRLLLLTATFWTWCPKDFAVEKITKMYHFITYLLQLFNYSTNSPLPGRTTRPRITWTLEIAINMAVSFSFSLNLP
jgi:hypothetical protein